MRIGLWVCVALALVGGCGRQQMAAIECDQPERPWRMNQFLIFLGWPDIGYLPVEQREPYVAKLAEMGINCVMDQQTVLDLCLAHGIDVMVYHNPTAPEIVAGVKDHPAVWGYFQYDEPKLDRLDEVAATHAAVHAVDPEHPSYTNIQSINYGVKPPYVQAFVDKVKPEILSYDFYQWYWPRHSNWQNLEFYRRAAQACGIPLVCWVEIDADEPGSPVNRVKMRHSVFSALVYGVKGIMWFTASRVFDKGQVTEPDYYADVQALNRELAHLGPELIRLNSTAVYHTDPPAYTSGPPADAPLTANDGFAVGLFTDAQGAAYALVMNRDWQRPRTAELRFARPVRRLQAFDADSGTWHDLPGADGRTQVAIDFDPADGVLLRYE